MNVERGFRRLMIVVSGLILALGLLAVVTGGLRVEGVAVIAGVLIGFLWATFFTVRWVVRGFLPASAPAAATLRSKPKSAEGGFPPARIVGGLMAGLVFGSLALGAVLVAVGVVAAVVAILHDPGKTWDTIRTEIPWNEIPGVVWLRQTVGDRAAAMIGFGLAILIALGAIFEGWDQCVLWRRSRDLRRLQEHSAACQACQQLADANPDDFAEEDKYCPVGKRLNRKYMRT